MKVLFYSLVVACVLLASCASREPQGHSVIATGVIVAPPSSDVAVSQDTSCGEGMAHIVGERCTQVEEKCEVWLDPPASLPFRRCQKFYPSTCVGKWVHKDFCMDKFEYIAPGESLPKNYVDYYQAEAMCKNEGKRMCKESEFETACGNGAAITPYPVGVERDCDACNCNQRHNLGKIGHRTDYRWTEAQMSKCATTDGVIGLVGNLDEMYKRDVSSGKYSVVERGGHWLYGVRNKCLNSSFMGATTSAHSELYSDGTLGFRCCDASH